MSSLMPVLDAYTPAQIAHRVETVGVQKAQRDAFSLFALGVLAGAFIALGGAFYLVVQSGSQLGYGVTRAVGGLSFCLGLVLVILAGAELFTGNNLVAMAWASKKVTTRALLRNWAIVYVGNVIGAGGTAVLVLLADVCALDGGAVGQSAVSIAVGKCALAPGVAFFRGVLCNVLVCLAVWLALGGRSFTDKLLGVLFPISAFVALGFEHSIANWFFLPYGLLLDADGVDLTHCLQNIGIVTLGNIVGGTLLVALVYWAIYLRPSAQSKIAP